MKKIVILLSTYNGEKYIKDQINSLILQSIPIEIYIRDDYSTDNTLKIAKEYQNKYKNVHIIDDEIRNNLGVKQSFFYLLKSVKADYYFFCDQDDYWLKDKVKKTLNIMDDTKPCLVYTNLSIVDEELNLKKKKMVQYQSGNPTNILKDIIVENTITGCTIAINSSLREKVLYHHKAFKDERMIMHDWYISIVASVYGNTYFLDEDLILYRQHRNNTIGALSIKRRIRKILNLNVLKNSIRKTANQVELFLEIESSVLPSDVNELLQAYKKFVYGNFLERVQAFKTFRFSKKKISKKIPFFILVFLGVKE